MAQRTETDIRELTDLIKGLGTKIEALDKKIEVLDKKMDLGFLEVDRKIEALDKKMDLKFADTDAKVQALSKTTELSFAEVNGKLDLVNSRLTGLDRDLKTTDVNITKLDTRIWAFGGFALTVSVGSLLTVFIRFMFMNSPKF